MARVPTFEHVCDNEACPTNPGSCTRTSTRSTPRSSSATIRGCAGRPVIVGGGVVLAASYEAKACGVRTAMGGRQARRAVPGCGRRPAAHARLLRRPARRCSRVFRDTTPLVEPLSIDEAFLDVRGLRQIARRAQSRSRAGCGREVRERVGLAITVGVARTKFLAKVASGVAKPDGLLVVPVDGELAFLHPLPVQRLWGVGRSPPAKLLRPRHHHGGRGRRPGRARPRVHARPGVRAPPARAGPQPRSASGRGRPAAPLDRRPVRARPPRAAPRPNWTLALIGARRPGLPPAARAPGRVCRTVVLRLRFDDFTRATRSHTLPRPTDDTAAVLAALRALLAADAG